MFPTPPSRINQVSLALLLHGGKMPCNNAIVNTLCIRVLKWLARAFKPLPEDLDIFAHHPLLGVEQILVFAWQLRECRIGHERIEFVQACGGFLRLSEETSSLFCVHVAVWL